MKYVFKLTHHVEKKIAKVLPDRFSIMFDGWSSAGTYYVGIYATFPSVKSVGYDSVCLAFSPLENEETYSEQEHMDLIEFVLQTFGKRTSHIVAIVADNCTTNRSISRLMQTRITPGAFRPEKAPAAAQFNLGVTALSRGARSRQLLPYQAVRLNITALSKPLVRPLELRICQGDEHRCRH